MDIMTFATLLLYKRFVSTRAGQASRLWELILKQCSHSTIPLPDFIAISRKYFDILSRQCSLLLHPTDTISSIDILFRIIRFNTQSFSIPELPSTSYMCHFDTLSKLNHSCEPNAILMFSVDNEANCDYIEPLQESSARASATLVTLRSIASDEELEVSYLSQLCADVDHRQKFLQESFQFSCKCPRCTKEKFILLSEFRDEMGPIDLGILDMERCHRLVCSLQSMNPLTARLQAIDKGIREYLQPALHALVSSSNVESTCIVFTHVYKLHDMIVSLVSVMMQCKASLSSRKDSHFWDRLIVCTVDMMNTCWELSHATIQLHEISFFLLAGTAAVRLLSDASSTESKVNTTKLLQISMKLMVKAHSHLDILLTSGKNNELFSNTKYRIQQCLKKISCCSL